MKAFPTRILSVLLLATLPLTACGAPSPDDVEVEPAGSAVARASSSSAPVPGASAAAAGHEHEDGHECAGKPGGHRFEKGPVTISEAPEFMRERLAAADADHDGVVTTDERKAAFRKMAEKRFADADKNGDQVLTADEVDDRKWKFVSRADADGDGRVAKAELEEAWKSGKLGRHGRHGAFRKHGDSDPPRDDTTTL